MTRWELFWNAKQFSRRETFRVCLIPAGVCAARVLAACGDSGNGSDQVGTPNGVSGSPTTLPPQPGAGTAPVGTAGSASMPSTGMAGSGVQAQAGATAPVTAGSGGSSAMNNDPGMMTPQTPADAGTMPVADAAMDPDPVAGPGVPWATGGTKTMTGKYPDPFAMGMAGAACIVYPSQTLGPCYAQGPEMRADISDGLDGLPMRLSLRLVKSDGCTPVANATIDIWHSGSQGIYSAYATGTICNPGTMNVMTDMFGRGVQTTDQNGRVDFDSVFPGWYTGRTIHIHFTVRESGREYVTSQLYFKDALSDEILAQGLYAARGKRDTTNATDSTYRSGGATAEKVEFEAVKRPDGALHAWKTIAISG